MRALSDERGRFWSWKHERWHASATHVRRCECRCPLGCPQWVLDTEQSKREHMVSEHLIRGYRRGLSRDNFCSSLRVINILERHMQPKLDNEVLFEARPSPPCKHLHEGSWVLLSCLKKEASDENAGRIMGFTRIERISEDGKGKWPVRYHFKRVYRLQCQATYAGAQQIMPNALGTGEHPELRAEIMRCLAEYAASEYDEASRYTWERVVVPPTAC